MSIADRIGPWFEDDLLKVAGTMGALYLAYIGIGMILGYSLRGQLNGLTRLTIVIGVFGMLALALNLQWGYTGMFNIGIVGFMAAGMYTMAVLAKPANIQQATRLSGFGVPLLLAVVAGTAVAALLGFVVALPALRLRADYLAIVTIAFAEIIRFIVKSGVLQEFELFGQTVGTGGGRGLILNYTDPIEGLLSTVGLWDAYLDLVDAVGQVIENNPKPIVDGATYAIFLFLMVAAFYWLLKQTGESPFGRVLKAVREDEDVARALGKDTRKFKIKAFMLGCALMGLAGILWKLRSGSITPIFFRPRITFYVWIALIIGGAGSNTGSVLGGAVFAGVLFEGPRYLKNTIEAVFDPGRGPTSFGQAVEPLSSSLDPVPLGIYTLKNVNSLQLVIMGVVLIWLMQNRPQGMLGHRKEIASSIPLSRPAGMDTGARTAGRPDEMDATSDGSDATSDGADATAADSDGAGSSSASGQEGSSDE
jgi:branched-chain amino acid transport system permease protein